MNRTNTPGRRVRFPIRNDPPGRKWRAGLVVLLLAIVAGCDLLPPSAAPTPTAGTVAPPPVAVATSTTIVVVVTVPPVPTVPRSAPSPIAVAAAPPPAPGPENPLKLTSDGISSPPGFRLVGGDYLVAWEVPRPTNSAGCYFGAVLQSEPSVSPFTFQMLGPWTVESSAGYAGSRRLDGLAAGNYTLRPGGDCPWTITITPIRGRS